MVRIILPTLPRFIGPARRVALGLAVVVVAGRMLGCGGGGESPEGGAGEASSGERRAPTVRHQAVEEALAAADEYFRVARLRDAATILETLVERAPDHLEARELFGQVRLAQGHEASSSGRRVRARVFFEQAAEQYRQALRIEPEVAGLHHSAGLVFNEAGHEGEALAAFERAVTLDPEQPQYGLYAAQLHLRTGDLERAASLLDRVLAQDPRLPHAHASMALVHLERGETDAALAAIARARELDPKEVTFRAQEARILRRGGDAEAALTRLLPLWDPDRVVLIVAEELARAYAALGQPERAAEAWQATYQGYLDAGDDAGAAAAARSAARSLHAAGRRQMALLWVQQASTIAPEDPRNAALEATIREAPASSDQSRP